MQLFKITKCSLLKAKSYCAPLLTTKQFPITCFLCYHRSGICSRSYNIVETAKSGKSIFNCNLILTDLNLAVNFHMMYELKYLVTVP